MTSFATRVLLSLQTTTTIWQGVCLRTVFDTICWLDWLVSVSWRTRIIHRTPRGVHSEKRNYKRWRPPLIPGIARRCCRGVYEYNGGELASPNVLESGAARQQYPTVVDLPIPQDAPDGSVINVAIPQSHGQNVGGSVSHFFANATLSNCTFNFNSGKWGTISSPQIKC